MGLYMLGAVSGYMNTTGFLGVHSAPVQSNAVLTQTQVTDVSNTTGQNIHMFWYTVSFISNFVFNVIGGGLLATFFIIPLLTQWGIPVAMAVMFQAPLTIIELFWVYSLITGNNPEW
jgi:hypothetical protein